MEEGKEGPYLPNSIDIIWDLGGKKKGVVDLPLLSLLQGIPSFEDLHILHGVQGDPRPPQEGLADSPDVNHFDAQGLGSHFF
jgi:hypothetical protein